MGRALDVETVSEWLDEFRERHGSLRGKHSGLNFYLIDVLSDDHGVPGAVAAPHWIVG